MLSLKHLKNQRNNQRNIHPSSSAAARRKAAAGSDGGSDEDGDEGDVEGDEDDDDGVAAGGPDDGNTDFCEVCDDAGDLLCCDVCPRSYHTACLGVAPEELPSGEWLCPHCVRTFGPAKERADSTTGPVVTARFYDGPAFSAREAQADGREAELLAIVRTLTQHEFVTNFAVPVPASLKEYHRAIPRPCDLGTIAARLEGRAGFRAAGGGGGHLYYGTGASFDAPRAITDLRLVWANCRAYNRPMSTISRMADVLSREWETALRDRLALSSREAARLKELRLAECSIPNMHG